MKKFTRKTVSQRLVAMALASAGLAVATLVAAAPGPNNPATSTALTAPSPSAITGPVRVVDGDTIVLGQTRIRLEGIDAPESGQTCKRRWLGSWACGTVATAALARMIEGHEVFCEPAGLDKYGRTLATCFAGGIDVNAEMVRQGMAWAYVKYSVRYVTHEAEARAQKIGIWQGEAQPAWDYRAAQWQKNASIAPEGCAIKGAVTKNGRIYHMPWSPWYDKVKIDADPAKRGERRWFCNEAEAVAAGWRPAMTR